MDAAEGRALLQTSRGTEFSRLLESVLASAYATAYNLTRNRESAADLVQEASVLAFKSFHTFQLGTNFRAWFLKVLTNAFLQSLRKAQRAPEMVDLEDAPDLYIYKRSREAGLAADAADPASVILEQLDAEDIAEAIGSLPEEFRVVATLYLIEDMSYEEIAEAVGVPIGTVRSRLHRSRKALQKSLWKLAESRGISVSNSTEGEIRE
jgi:RNA polymerase sigma-70 factor (ECF subfamily)